MLKDLAGKSQRSVARDELRATLLQALGNSTTQGTYNGSIDG